MCQFDDKTAAENRFSGCLKAGVSDGKGLGILAFAVGFVYDNKLVIAKLYILPRVGGVKIRRTNRLVTLRCVCAASGGWCTEHQEEE